jgi:hypothetical protein
MELAIIIVITLCAVIIIPWMIRKDFEKRITAALKREIQNDISRLQEYIRDIPDRPESSESSGQSSENDHVLILDNQIFRKMQMQDFRPKSMSPEDMEMLEKVFTTSSQQFRHTLKEDSEKLCTANLRVLERILQKITGGIEDTKVT